MLENPLLLHYFVKRWQLIAEDIAVTKFLEAPKILPSAPYIKLSNEASERLKITTEIKTIKESDNRTFYNGFDF